MYETRREKGVVWSRYTSAAEVEDQAENLHLRNQAGSHYLAFSHVGTSHWCIDTFCLGLTASSLFIFVFWCKNGEGRLGRLERFSLYGLYDFSESCPLLPCVTSEATAQAV